MLTTLVAIVPSAGALFLFWIVLRAILQADRRERLAQARNEAAEDAAAARAAAAAGPGAGADIALDTAVDTAAENPDRRA